MKILFLGTGASDFEATSHKNSCDFRRNSSALVNRELLIDPGPCVFEALRTFDVDVGKIKYIINTHSHPDHYHRETVDKLTKRGAEFISLVKGDIKEIGRYSVSALQANHGTATSPVHFLISDGKSTLFYALDGAWLTYEEVSVIRKKHIDLAVLDATIGDIKGDYRIFEHNNLNMVKEMKYSLEPYVDKFIISHIARTLHTDHKTLMLRMSEIGINVAYDGLEIEV